MASLSFRRTYHQSVPQAIRVDNHHFGPLPLYVELSDFLIHGDFVGAQLLSNENKPVVALKLSHNAQTKFNQIALENSGAQKLEDYVGLFLYFNGVRSDHMMMALSQLPGDECWINGLSEIEANSIVNSLSPRPKL